MRTHFDQFKHVNYTTKRIQITHHALHVHTYDICYMLIWWIQCVANSQFVIDWRNDLAGWNQHTIVTLIVVVFSHPISIFRRCSYSCWWVLLLTVAFIILCVQRNIHFTWVWCSLHLCFPITYNSVKAPIDLTKEASVFAAIEVENELSTRTKWKMAMYFFRIEIRSWLWIDRSRRVELAKCFT